MEAIQGTDTRAIGVVEAIAKLIKEEKASRRTFLGASEIAAVAGLSRWATPLDIWMRKTGRIPEQADNAAMRLGRKLEPVVAEIYSEDAGTPIKYDGVTYRHYRELWAGATPDYRHADDWQTLVEIKTSNGRGHDWSEGAPLHYQAQAQWQMGVTQATRAVVACLTLDERKVYRHTYEYDSDVFGRLLDLGRAFWRCVEDDSPPPARAGDEELLRRLSGDPVGAELIVDEDETLRILLDEHEALSQNLKRSKESIQEIETLVKNCEARIRQRMGTAGTLRCGEWIAKQALVSRAGHTVKPSSYVKFSIKRIK